MSAWMAMLTEETANVAALERLYLQYRGVPGFIPEITARLDQLDEEVAWRAVWILRRASIDGLLRPREIERIARCVDASTHWAWRLLLCQLFGRVECPVQERENLFPFLLDCFQDRRVIVRAWALSAMWHFRGDTRYRPEILACMRAARKDTGKSMQARLRHLPGVA